MVWKHDRFSLRVRGFSFVWSTTWGKFKNTLFSGHSLCFFLNSSFYKKSFFSVGLDQINKHRTLKTYVVCVSLWICINNIKPKSLLREFILKTNFTNGSLVLLLSCIHERNFNQKSPSKRFWLFDRWPHQSQLVFLQRWQKPFKDFLSFFSM